jgi:hypothetical protein
MWSGFGAATCFVLLKKGALLDEALRNERPNSFFSSMRLCRSALTTVSFNVLVPAKESRATLAASCANTSFFAETGRSAGDGSLLWVKLRNTNSEQNQSAFADLATKMTDMGL